MSKYPEHAKRESIMSGHDTLSAFIEESDYVLAKYEHGELVQVRMNGQQVANEYFEIDENKIEAERRQMIEEMKGLSK